MTLYAIGDIQGCAHAFDRLLEAIAFDASQDRLWLAGDLVNRGPRSLEVLRRVVSIGESATTVLGNHDLHLLATAAGVRPAASDDTFEDVLNAPDASELLDWLRHRPLLHYDASIEHVLVHAGLPPSWSLEDARRHADEVSRQLKGPAWARSLSKLYGNEPRAWSPSLAAEDRRRYTINALTRMRYCDRRGHLDFEHAGPPGTQPPELVPWFDFPERETRRFHIVFGHWASLGLLVRPDVTALDTGCVWGRALTAMALKPPGEPVSVECGETSRSPGSG